ncbi:flagellar hook assembly protein FlgD [Evansella sp. AB-P1]|uniref:flagellar hook assembly protein FlgD n=1 Tax=Evansella sp. AB-P1 TaxID=3037653 RepID=UPI00241BE887|nr:flagellar hook assembly protein FlgD [Evansella sp. AB-P1]MDG5788186.1 flagellar hook assembly protein FlgD [Evansella sp. AB-P1]
MPNAVSNSLYLSEYQKAQQNQRNTGELDKDAFLRLLVAQLQNQDPLNPMEDTEFISQMAQFTSLEQMTNMNKSLEKFIEQQQQNHFVSHSELIGKKVEWEIERRNEDGSVQRAIKDGIVTSVKFKNGAVELLVDDEITISTKEVQSVSLPNKEE